MSNRTCFIDFETHPIIGNPITNPPEPVGVAVKIDDNHSRYFTGDAMNSVVRYLFDSEYELVFHNAPFDISVARKWIGVDWPAWHRVHDTMFLVFLNSPHSNNLGLKDAAQELLGIEPARKNDLDEWILENIPQATKRSTGRWIYKAPEALVAPYACQDTDLTYALYDMLIDAVPRAAYDRERELQPYLVEATRKGVRINREHLAQDLIIAADGLIGAEEMIREKLAAPGLEMNKGVAVANAMLAAKMTVPKDEWPRTPKSKKLKTDKATLIEVITDEDLLALMLYRSALSTIVSTFMKPWLEMSSEDGRLHPNWNQVRTHHSGAKFQGTRTGRLSSDSPNFQNIPNELPVTAPPGLPKVPSMRDYVLPEEGQQWASLDFSSQEMRILGHFEPAETLAKMSGPKVPSWDGATANYAYPERPQRLKELGDEPHTIIADAPGEAEEREQLLEEYRAREAQYRAERKAKQEERRRANVLNEGFKKNPDMDPHQMVGNMVLASTGKEMPRKAIKGIGFGLMYGMGIDGLSKTLKKPREEAQEMVNLYVNALPGIERVKFCCKALSDQEKPIVTWGGRKYYKENAKNGRDYAYKLTNYLIQGSAADQTKECLLRYFRNKPENETFLCTVHDEINISVPTTEATALREAMEAPLAGLDIPMRTTTEIGETWGDCE